MVTQFSNDVNLELQLVAQRLPTQQVLDSGLGLGLGLGGPSGESPLNAVGASNDGKACFSVRFVDHALGKKTSATCAAHRPYMVLKNKTGGLEEAMVAFIIAPEFMGQ